MADGTPIGHAAQVFARYLRQRSLEFRVHVMKEEMGRSVPHSQREPVVWQIAPAIEQPIPDCLVHGDTLVFRLEMQRPRRLAHRLWRIIQAETYAVFALR